jgi:hypothetical protein
VAAAASRKAIGLVLTVIRVIGLVIIAILVIHILLTVFGANPANSFATFIRDGANTFSLGLTDLFQPPNRNLAVGLNYGIAALLWLIIMSIVLGLVRRVG